MGNFKCPICGQFLSPEAQSKYRKYLSKDIMELYREKQIKSLTFYHSSIFSPEIYQETWCEIDLLTQKDNFSVYLKGENVYYVVPDHPLGKFGLFIDEKTKIHSNHLEEREIQELLINLFQRYDIRLLGEKALLSHPACCYLESGSDTITVYLELVDGAIDEINFNSSSIASNILNSIINRNSLLGKWFGVGYINK